MCVIWPPQLFHTSIPLTSATPRRHEKITMNTEYMHMPAYMGVHGIILTREEHYNVRELSRLVR